MLALCCHWDDAEAFKKSDTASKKLLRQWTHTCKAFGIFHLIVIGKEGSVPVLGDTEIKVECFESYADVRSKYHTDYIIITEDGNPLWQLIHPEECIYVVGSNYANPVINKDDIAVKLKTAPLIGHTDRFFPLWDVAAASIVLHDRLR